MWTHFPDQIAYRFTETRPPLRVPAEQALETVWALTSPELHQLLVRVRGWTRDRYRDWLAHSLSTVLLDDDAP